MKKFFKEYWRDIISLFSLLLTIIGLALAIHIYIRDIRPIMENTELYHQITELKEQKSEVEDYIKEKIKEIGSLEVQIGQIKTEKSDFKLEIEVLERELIKSYKSYFLDKAYLEIRQDYISSIRGMEEFNVDVKHLALEYLKDNKPVERYKQEGLKQAINFIEEYINPDSEYSDILYYEIKELEKVENQDQE